MPRQSKQAVKQPEPVIKSLQEFEEKYLPTTAAARKVSKMNKQKYVEWYAKTSYSEREKVTEELKNIAHRHLDEYNRIISIIYSN